MRPAGKPDHSKEISDRGPFLNWLRIQMNGGSQLELQSEFPNQMMLLSVMWSVSMCNII